MSDSVVFDALDALYDKFVADATLAAMVTAQTLKIFDGPPTVDFSAPSILVVGARPIVDDDSATTVEWDWGTLGVSGTLAEVDETHEIPCGISSRDGNNDMRTCRHTARDIWKAAAAVVRGTTLSIPQVMWCIPQVASIRQLHGASGSDVVVSFTAHVRTRI
jgi:hypothetical protein